MGGDLSVALLAGLGGMLGWGLADFFAKKAIDEIGDVPALVWGHLLGTVLIGCILYAKLRSAGSVAVPANVSQWLVIGVFGTLQAAVYLLVYRGFAKGQISLLAPLFASFAGIVALLSVLLFGEPMSVRLILPLLLTFGGVLALSLDPDQLRRRRLAITAVPGLAEVAVATLLAAAWTLGWDRAVQGKDSLVSAAIMYAFMTAALLAYSGARGAKLAIPKGPTWLLLALVGGCEVAAYVAISWGYGTTIHTSIVALVSSAFALPTIVLARVFLKERTGRWRAGASAAIVAGIVLLGVR
jgi:drug/metabolite transporter (DMT)-like permease